MLTYSITKLRMSNRRILNELKPVNTNRKLSLHSVMQCFIRALPLDAMDTIVIVRNGAAHSTEAADSGAVEQRSSGTKQSKSGTGRDTIN